MFDDKEKATGLGGVTVQDAWVALQILDKAASNGVIQPTEFEVVGQWRKNMTDAIRRAIGKDYDQILMEQIQRLRQEQMAANSEREPSVSSTTDVDMK